MLRLVCCVDEDEQHEKEQLDGGKICQELGKCYASIDTCFQVRITRTQAHTCQATLGKALNPLWVALSALSLLSTAA
jgi:hypothetical protein